MAFSLPCVSVLVSLLFEPLRLCFWRRVWCAIDGVELLHRCSIAAGVLLPHRNDCRQPVSMSTWNLPRYHLPKSFGVCGGMLTLPSWSILWSRHQWHPTRLYRWALLPGWHFVSPHLLSACHAFHLWLYLRVPLFSCFSRAQFQFASFLILPLSHSIYSALPISIRALRALSAPIPEMSALPTVTMCAPLATTVLQAPPHHLHVPLAPSIH